MYEILFMQDVGLFKTALIFHVNCLAVAWITRIPLTAGTGIIFSFAVMSTLALGLVHVDGVRLCL
jgi:hypothetical protein